MRGTCGMQHGAAAVVAVHVASCVAVRDRLPFQVGPWVEARAESGFDLFCTMLPRGCSLGLPEPEWCHALAWSYGWCGNKGAMLCVL